MCFYLGFVHWVEVLLLRIVAVSGGVFAKKPFVIQYMY